MNKFPDYITHESINKPYHTDITIQLSQYFPKKSTRTQTNNLGYDELRFIM